MIAEEIIRAIEEFAPRHIQENWDNSGLIIGSPQQEVNGILLGFDCTPELVDEAVAVGADMIVTHHPLIFTGLRKLDPRDPVQLTVMKAVKAGIAVYAAHTTADKVIAGVSGAMARKLGLIDIQVLDVEDGGVGLGAFGVWPEPKSSEDAVRFVKETFGIPVVKCSRLLEEPVSKVAMCGGSGSSLIDKARESGAQMYICADISYHYFFTPKGFMLMDVGHFESEVEIVDILFSMLRKKFPNFAVRLSEKLSASNPVKYY